MTTERKELLEALGTLLDLVQLTRLLDKAKLSESDMKDFLWAKSIHSKYSHSPEESEPRHEEPTRTILIVATVPVQVSALEDPDLAAERELQLFTDALHAQGYGSVYVTVKDG